MHFFSPSVLYPFVPIPIEMRSSSSSSHKIQKYINPSNFRFHFFFFLHLLTLTLINFLRTHTNQQSAGAHEQAHKTHPRPLNGPNPYPQTKTAFPHTPTAGCRKPRDAFSPNHFSTTPDPQDHDNEVQDHPQAQTRQAPTNLPPPTFVSPPSFLPRSSLAHLLRILHTQYPPAHHPAPSQLD